ncbi:MAG: ferredoxin [Candidatus Ranarchaeia archaeon]
MSDRILKVDKDLCIECATCWDNLPEFFNPDDEGKSSIVEEYQTEDDDSASFGEPPEELIMDIEEIIEECPASAISFVED